MFPLNYWSEDGMLLRRCDELHDQLGTSRRLYQWSGNLHRLWLSMVYQSEETSWNILLACLESIVRYGSASTHLDT